MRLLFTPKLQSHLGLLSLRLKDKTCEPSVTETEEQLPKHNKTSSNDTVSSEVIFANNVDTSASPSNQAHMPKPDLEKNDFRLLVKILQAIGHDCVFNHIVHRDNKVIYRYPNRDLIFHDITKPDDTKNMHLSSLSDMNSDPKLKRAVWEKLKTLS